MGNWQNQILFLLFNLLLFNLICFGYVEESGSCGAAVHDNNHGHHHEHHHHQCGHSHVHLDDHHHHHHRHKHEQVVKSRLLPEEVAEDEDLDRYGHAFLNHDDDHDHHHFQNHHEHLSGVALWVNALGCSFLVSMASLVCLIILPLIFVQGRPSKAVVDSLALFGAGAMLGDAFLHQLPHAFCGEHSHSHDHHVDNAHQAHSGDHSHSHSHSLKDLSIGLSVLAGIVLFLLVEKLVRYVEENSRGDNKWSHGHHHHHHHKSSKRVDANSSEDNQSGLVNGTDRKASGKPLKDTSLGEASDKAFQKNDITQQEFLRKRNTNSDTKDDGSAIDAGNDLKANIQSFKDDKNDQSPSSLVFGYLNLFSDGVHNFTDGIALGSAFLLYGTVGGWSRTLFLLAHELPQEVGDFGILVRSGFSVSKALFFNFLSALVALAGTAIALLMGRDPGQSSLIEGFTAGGFIYIAVAGVLAELNNNGKTTLKSTAVELMSLMLGMAVALFISLVE